MTNLLAKLSSQASLGVQIKIMTSQRYPADVEVRERIRQLIERSGKQHKEIASQLDWDDSTVSRKLDGSRKLTVGEMVEILKILGIATSVEDLFNLIESVMVLNSIGLKINPKNLILFLTKTR